MIYVLPFAFAIPAVYFISFIIFGIIAQKFVTPSPVPFPVIKETAQQLSLTPDLYNGKVIASFGGKVLVVTSRGCEWLDPGYPCVDMRRLNGARDAVRKFDIPGR